MENTCFLKSDRPAVSWTPGNAQPSITKPFEQLQVCQSPVLCHLDCLSKEKHGVLGRKTYKNHISKVPDCRVA